MKRDLLSVVVTLSLLPVFVPARSLAEPGTQAWLRYAPLDRQASQSFSSLPATTVVLGNSAVLKTAQQELIRGVRGMLGRSLRPQDQPPKESAILLATLKDLRVVGPGLKIPGELHDDGFWLAQQSINGFDCLVITATNDRGVLYGVFALLSKIARDQSLLSINEVQQPYVPLR